MAYEGHRAMFEAFGRNKYKSTGVIQWMLNNAWPSMIWHLYDWYLRPGGSYLGPRRAVNRCTSSTVTTMARLLSSIRCIRVCGAEGKGLGLQPGYDGEVVKGGGGGRGGGQVHAGTDAACPGGLSTTYFVRLALEDASGKTVSTNFYWLSYGFLR
ncbi:hypothetical protein [Paludibaculum fermentans]|uniref:Uncharacterized protein n=1 Tax=Paludibaculum fermentans TaxID=1473598 RepID=A0A7S7SLI6_PALFE|nr:hypothetical protein [Paludibaculum fermentans]QOY89409.1 hypothetical protein IRI77_05485 [Paludibaculum fermentans]